MRTTKICVTVTGETMAELRERRDRVTGADLVELRIDTVSDPSAAGALEGRRLPAIVTCRPRWEGGQFAGAEEERRRLLRDAQRLGAEYIDVEWKAGFDDLLSARHGQGVVLSMHDHDGVPADLEARASAMRSTGAEIIKLAAMAKRLRDCLPFLAIGRASTTPVALVAMGEPGTPTRVLASRFGSCWTYAGDAVAPGQMTACTLQDEFGFRSLTDRTALYGVVGRPVAHSISPPMHNAAFRAAHVDAVYLPFAAADFADFLGFAEAMALEGASVTAPFKVDAFESSAESDPVSRRIRSVNTLRRVAGRWAACNTDVAGFLKPLQARMPIEGRRTTIMGAGGAARAVAEALSAAGARVAIAARARARAEDASRLTGVTVVDWPPPPGSWDVLVNATPVGTAPDVTATPLPDGPFTGALVYDLVYNPPETKLLRDARAAGCQTLGGLDMLVAQAELQFEWWTGRRPADHVMRDAAMAALGRLTPQGTFGTFGTLGTL